MNETNHTTNHSPEARPKVTALMLVILFLVNLVILFCWQYFVAFPLDADVDPRTVLTDQVDSLTQIQKAEFVDTTQFPFPYEVDGYILEAQDGTHQILFLERFLGFSRYRVLEASISTVPDDLPAQVQVSSRLYPGSQTISIYSGYTMSQVSSSVLLSREYLIGLFCAAGLGLTVLETLFWILLQKVRISRKNT